MLSLEKAQFLKDRKTPFGAVASDHGEAVQWVIRTLCVLHPHGVLGLISFEIRKRAAEC